MKIVLPVFKSCLTCEALVVVLSGKSSLTVILQLALLKESGGGFSFFFVCFIFGFLEFFLKEEVFF